MSILGNRVRRVEDPRFLLGQGTYLADLRDPRLEGAAHLTFVRSMFAHGRIVDVDTSEAVGAPGVRAVFTAADLDLVPARPGGAGAPAAMARPWLASDTVRFVGEPVVVIVSDTPTQGADAAELVIVDVDPLPAVIGVDDGLTDQVLLFPEAGTNVNSVLDEGWDDTAAAGDDGDGFWDGCEVVVRARVVNQRVAGVPIEGRGSAAWWDGDRLTQWISSQAPHGARAAIATAHGLEHHQVRVITPDVGGGFGPKITPAPEDVLVGWVARRLGRPARWSETRTENLLAQSQGRDHVHQVAIGGTRDGRILAYELDILADAGAYPLMGAFLPYFTRLMATGVYDLPRVRSRSRAVVTTTVPTEAFRGAGRPEATATVERAVDLFAAEIGMDAAECRRRNLVAPDAFPYTTAAGATYDVGAYEEALDRALAAAGYTELRDEQARRRDAGDQRMLGIGVSTYVEITGAGTTTEFGGVRILPADDGGVRVTLLTGSSPHGQGLATALTMVASDVLGLPPERIEVLHGDTDVVPFGMGTMGSRSLQMGGSAVHTAATQVLEAARRLAAAELEADPADIVLDPDAGAFHVVGTPSRRVDWARVAAAAEEVTLHAADGGAADEEAANPLWVEGRFETDGLTFPFGAHVAVVEVDVETGLVDLVRLVACDDAGRIVNPLLAEGQRHGGITQGVAQALFEAVRYDADGNPLTATLADYGIPSAADLPRWELVAMETPTPMNPLGAKGIGESGTIGATPAVQSAVVDAVAHLGIRHIDLPLTPETVWRAIQGAGTAPQGASARP